MHSHSWWSQYTIPPRSYIVTQNYHRWTRHGRTNPTIRNYNLRLFRWHCANYHPVQLLIICIRESSEISYVYAIYCPSSYPTWQHSIEWISRQRMMWWNDDSVWQRIEERSGIYWLSDEIKSNRFKLQPMKYLLLLLSCWCNWLFAHFN